MFRPLRGEHTPAISHLLLHSPGVNTEQPVCPMTVQMHCTQYRHAVLAGLGGRHVPPIQAPILASSYQRICDHPLSNGPYITWTLF